MLQELAAETRGAFWAIASMLFFLAAWVGVVVWLIRKRPEDMEAQARLPFDGDDGGDGERRAASDQRPSG
jgi:hypothetical protein